jgi:ParB family chromosome partitioning protein
MPPEKSPRRLGRGLDALFNAVPDTIAPTKETSALKEIPVGEISRNPFQPRKSFKPTELRELQESLEANGLLQPVTVRTAAAGKGYELIAGERRLRAATNLGWKTIPAVVKEMTDREILTLALVENLQRSDLNPIEEAEGYDQLIREFGYTQQTVAGIVGKDRSTVANVLRILQLPPAVRELVQDGHLSAGQARPLLGLDETAQITLFAKQAVEEGWSAREVERRVRESGETQPVDTRATPKRGRPRKADTRSPELKNVEQMLRKHLQTDVSVTLKTETRGTVSIEFYSPEDLERLMELIGVSDNSQ